jgi:nucleoside-diphosphate-sugar epimerase
LHLDIETNLTKLMHVLPQMDHRGTFNFVSSWFVYGDRGSHHVTEDAHCDPKGFYSITKHCAEKLIQSYCATVGSRYRILRLSNVIGKDPRASSKKNALEYLMGKIRRHEPIQIYDGDNYRNYLDVEDCCRAIQLVLDKGNKNETYNIGAVESVRLFDIIQYAMLKTNSRSHVEIVEVPHFHKTVQTQNFFMNTDKLQALGFKQKYDIWETIDRLLK